MGNLTNNFSIEEFASGDSVKWIPSSDYQKWLILKLAIELQKVRDLLIQGPIHILNGVRVFDDYKRLCDSGYNPSSVSDHYFGNVVPIDINNKKYKVFGKYYYFSVGAADVGIIDIPNNFKRLINLNEQGKISFGQIIYEKSSDGKKEWVHFSNDYRKIFSPDISKLINKEKYLQSFDNGKTYQKVII